MKNCRKNDFQQQVKQLKQESFADNMPTDIKLRKAQMDILVLG